MMRAFEFSANAAGIPPPDAAAARLLTILAAGLSLAPDFEPPTLPERRTAVIEALSAATRLIVDTGDGPSPPLLTSSKPYSLKNSRWS